MTILTRLRRALCRHDWLPFAPSRSHLHGIDARCRKCGVLRRTAS